MKVIQYTGSITFRKEGYDDDVITSVESPREHLRDLKILRRIYRDGKQVFKILVRTTYPESRSRVYEYQITLRVPMDGTWRGGYSYEDPVTTKPTTNLIKDIKVGGESGFLKITADWIEANGDVWGVEINGEEISLIEVPDEEVPWEE